jgi:hypothetical protein
MRLENSRGYGTAHRLLDSAARVGCAAEDVANERGNFED